MVAAENKNRRREERAKYIYGSARKDIGEISSKDNFIFVLALYADKEDRSGGKGAFTSSNPFLIKFMIKWLNLYCNLKL